MNPTPRFPVPAPEPGVYRNTPADEYHSWAAVSSSMAKSMSGGALVCKRFMDKPGSIPTAAMRFGTAIHAALFEPELFMAATEIKGLKPNAQAETFQKHADKHGPLILAEGWGSQIRAICEVVDNHPYASELCDGGEAEVSVVWDEVTTSGRTIRCKARLDYLKPLRLVELKSCDHKYLDPDSFTSHAWKMGYHTQIGHEWRAWCSMARLRSDAGVTILAVSSTEPFECVVYEPDDGWILAGLDQWSKNLDAIACCLERDEWPGMATEPVSLEIPGWARRSIA